MSQLKEQTVITYQIGMSDECKKAIADFGASIQSAFALLSNFKVSEPTGGLLAAMNAANDEPELKELGQWVFEGQDEKWQTFAVTGSGTGWFHNRLQHEIYYADDIWYANCDIDHEIEFMDCKFDCPGASIQRETVNDVEYLSDDKDSVAEELLNFNWTGDREDFEKAVLDEKDLAKNLGFQVTTNSDIQLDFIKNLSELLTYRMISMDRFSEDDYAIGGDKLMPWDIVIDPFTKWFGVVTELIGTSDHATILFFNKPFATSVNWTKKNNAFANLSTITESELPTFRAALEASYG